MTTLTSISPINNEVYVQRDYAQSDDIAAALSRSTQAGAAWAMMPIAERAQYCLQAVDYFIAHADQIAEEITWQMGRPLAQAKNEIDGLAQRARHMVAIADSSLAPIELPEKPGLLRSIQREPLGVVLVLAPWNYPYLTAVNSIIPALMAGNTVILKHAQQTPLCAERFAQAFASVGLPEGVFEYLHLQHDQVAQLVQDPKVNFVAFTGSVAGGRSVQQAAMNRFIPMGLELGGKDPAYVRADANVSYAVEALVDGAFYNSGQSCCGIERIYVHRDVYDSFVEQFAVLVKQYCLGDPLAEKTTLGPMVKVQAKTYVQQQIKQAIEAGAQAIIDENLFPAAQPDSAYCAPQVLLDVNHAMTVMQEESFGPVVGIMPVSDDNQAIALMNDSQYGLTASLFTQDADLAKTLGASLQTGTVFMNRCDYLDPALVWTGVKNSGRGYSLSQLGYQQLTRAKSFHFKRL